MRQPKEIRVLYVILNIFVYFALDLLSKTLYDVKSKRQKYRFTAFLATSYALIAGHSFA